MLIKRFKLVYYFIMYNTIVTMKHKKAPSPPYSTLVHFCFQNENKLHPDEHFSCATGIIYIKCISHVHSYTHVTCACKYKWEADCPLPR